MGTSEMNALGVKCSGTRPIWYSMSVSVKFKGEHFRRKME